MPMPTASFASTWHHLFGGNPRKSYEINNRLSNAKTSQAQNIWHIRRLDFFNFAQTDKQCDKKARLFCSIFDIFQQQKCFPIAYKITKFPLFTNLAKYWINPPKNCHKYSMSYRRVMSSWKFCQIWLQTVCIKIRSLVEGVSGGPDGFPELNYFCVNGVTLFPQSCKGILKVRCSFIDWSGDFGQ